MIRTAVACLLICSGPVRAGTCDGGITMVECAIGANKTLSVCFSGDEARYTYGPPGSPELALTRSLDDIAATPWPGVGRSVWEEVVFTNGDVAYAVWTSVDRLDPDYPADGGVRVLQDDRELASLTCRTGTADVTAFAVSDAYAAAGYCRDPDNQAWTRDCPD